MTAMAPYGEAMMTTTVEQADSHINLERQRKLNVLKSMGGIQVTTGIILTAMGGTSMVLECYLSRIGNPIWSGICFFMVTGLIGLGSITSGKQGVITFYAICSGMSTACAGQLFSMSIYGATQEKEFLCRPGVDTDSLKLCTYVIEARIGINVCIAIVAFIALIACFTASCVTCTIPAPATTQVVLHAAPQPRPVEPSLGTSFVPMDPTKPYGSVEPPPYSNE